MGSASFGFTGQNVAAQRVAARSAARLVTAIARETMLAIRAVIVSSIRDGTPAYESARAIRSMVGLNEQQARAAESYRRDLIESGLSLDRVDRELDRYTAREVRRRARTIARTEVMTALNEGQREAWREAKQDGLLTERAVVEWIVTPDDKLCPICAPLDGVQVPLGKRFDTAVGTLSGPPAHPNCRCASAVTDPLP